MQAFSIVAVSVLAAISYGVIHDQITARICVEYFTIGHPRLIDSDSPTVLALFWGVAATWWVGLPLGLGLAVAARAGRRPKLGVARIRRPLITLVCWMLALRRISCGITLQLMVVLRQTAFADRAHWLRRLRFSP
ncbi:MAG: hypothetical protein EOP86_18840 [Verrucomicrobiaceae bacterium]|nr:MAG: hypothetical protein EOP86_18840 [Verrucomicrobiaceae bacterium]